MDIYRKFIKQTYKTYSKNPKFRQYLISVYKTNYKNLNIDSRQI